MKADLTSLILGLSDMLPLGGRVHWGLQPQNASALPYANLALLSGPQSYSLDGDTGRREDLVQADIWSASADQAEALRLSLQSALSGWRGIVGATRFRGVFLAGFRDLDGRGLGDQAPIHGASVDLLIRWNAAP